MEPLSVQVFPRELDLEGELERVEAVLELDVVKGEGKVGMDDMAYGEFFI